MAKRSKKKKKSPEVAAQKPASPPRPTSPLQTGLPSNPATISWKVLLQCGVMVAAVFAIYGPALQGDWLWDDDTYITGNFLLHTLAGLGKIWFEPGATRDYYPLSSTVQWMQWQLWGMNTLGYHLTNVVLHIVSSLLVWRLLSKFGLRLAWLGGLLFAIHPVQVESVAWISELKNTLSLPLLLGAMIRWIDYDERKKARHYWLALALFVIATLCKLSVVLLPLVLLLYAWWRRGRIGWNDVKASVPFFAAALAVGLVTVVGGSWDQQFNHLQPDFYPAGGILGRLALAGQAAAFYFSKVFLPVDLLPVYPLWPVDYTSPLAYLPWLVLAVVISWLWSKKEIWGRHALLGLGFFLINLAPCPGFLPAPNMGYAWVMDHFLYLPIIGLIGLAVAALEQLSARIPDSFRLGAIGIIVLMMAALGWESRGYAGLYVNQETLWTYTLQRNPEAWPAYNNLGNVLLQEGRVSEAIERCNQALKIRPDYAEAHNNLGVALIETGHAQEAIEQGEEALKIKPNYAEAHSTVGNALLHLGRNQEAMDQFEQALQIKPNSAEAHNNLGNALMHAGRIPEAIEQFDQALKIKPDYAEPHVNLGNILLQTGRIAESLEECERAVKIKPDFAEAYNNLGNALLKSGRGAEALDAYGEAVRLNPNFAEAHYNMGIALGQAGHFSEAASQFEQALQINPGFANARANLAKAQALLKDGPKQK
jgi:tetratricopeptide (TPR) repeat protein